MNGLLIYRGRGGAAGGGKPRKPKPAPGAASAELEVPRRRIKIARKLKYNSDGSDLDELRRELGGDLPPAAEPGPPAEPVRIEPDPNDPVWRVIGSFDRSGE